MKPATITIARRGNCWYIVDGDVIIALGDMSSPKAALKLHDYKQTWA